MDLSAFEEIIGYKFNDKELLTRALTHSSYANENKLPHDNERLEFLGDSVLGFVTAEYLVDEFLEQVYLLGATTEMERQLVVDSQVRMDYSPDVTLHFVENNTISKFFLCAFLIVEYTPPALIPS